MFSVRRSSPALDSDNGDNGGVELGGGTNPMRGTGPGALGDGANAMHGTGPGAGVGFGTDHLRGVLGQYLGQAVDVIIMMMRQQNVAKSPAGLGQGRQNGCGFGHVYKGCVAAGRIMGKKGVIVRQAGDGQDFKRHDFIRHGIPPFHC